MRSPPDFRHSAVLIAYRLWTRQSTMRDSRKAFGLTREARIMAESGAIYAVTVILIIATYTSSSNSFNVFLDMVREAENPPAMRFISLTTCFVHDQASPVIGVAVSGTQSRGLSLLFSKLTFCLSSTPSS